MDVRSTENDVVVVAFDADELATVMACLVELRMGANALTDGEWSVHIGWPAATVDDLIESLAPVVGRLMDDR